MDNLIDFNKICSDQRFLSFYELVCDYNNKVNLTAILQKDEFFVKHIYDSLAGAKYFASGAKAVEVGSGAGFPSMPLKLLKDDINFTLIESIGKKCVFLEYAVGKLGLSGVKVLNIRAEDAGKDASLRESFDICCARAVARLNSLLEYCIPLVKVGGRFIAYKGDAEEEILQAERAAKILGCEVEHTEKYSLPMDMGSRTLVVYKKIAPTPRTYPRGQGKERKNPL